jgi:hypothetical protein
MHCNTTAIQVTHCNSSNALQMENETWRVGMKYEKKKMEN